MLARWEQQFPTGLGKEASGYTSEIREDFSGVAVD